LRQRCRPVDAAYDRIAVALSAEYAGRIPLVLAVMIRRTGARRREIHQRVDFASSWIICTPRAIAGHHRRRPAVEAPARHPTGRRHVLVIDDILDEGHTLVAVRKALQEFAPGQPQGRRAGRQKA